jgi:hypothetical protein
MVWMGGFGSPFLFQGKSMEINKRVPIPKELQAYPGDDKRYLIYKGVFFGSHRFAEYQEDGTPMRSIFALSDSDMEKFFPKENHQ